VNESLIDLLELLSKNHVDFIIIGGYAGIVYGCTYVTQDVDICIDLACENLLRLQSTLNDFHPVHRMTPNRIKLELTESNCTQFKNLYLDTDLGQLDCLGYVEGVGDYSQAKEKSQIVEVETFRARVLNLDSLIESKKALNRPRDRQMLRELQAIKKLER
jgi:hypothetical protein